jgi:hypothetical protein
MCRISVILRPGFRRRCKSILHNRRKPAQLQLDEPILAARRFRSTDQPFCGCRSKILWRQDQGWPDRMKRAFQIRSKLLVLSFCQFSRENLSPSGNRGRPYTRAIDFFAFLSCRIRARNVKIPILHEVVISIVAARFSSAGKARIAVRHQGGTLVIRWGFGLDPFNTPFKILGQQRRRRAQAKLQANDRQQR